MKLSFLLQNHTAQKHVPWQNVFTFSLSLPRIGSWYCCSKVCYESTLNPPPLGLVPVHGGTHTAHVAPTHARPPRPHVETACLESNWVLLFADELRLVTLPAGRRCQLGEIKLCWSWGWGGCCPLPCHRRAHARRAALPRGAHRDGTQLEMDLYLGHTAPKAGVGLLRVIV